jgi:hypothetical protein
MTPAEIEKIKEQVGRSGEMGIYLDPRGKRPADPSIGALGLAWPASPPWESSGCPAAALSSFRIGRSEAESQTITEAILSLKPLLEDRCVAKITGGASWGKAH